MDEREYATDPTDEQWKLIQRYLPPSKSGTRIEWTWELGHGILEIVKRNDDVTGVQVLPRRWMVERTFGWFGRYRRRSKDYETLTDSSEAVIYLAMTHVMLRRLKPCVV